MKRSHPWRKAIAAQVRAVKAAKARRPRGIQKGRAYAAMTLAHLCLARGGKDLY